MPHTLFRDDNFHFSDETERVRLADYESAGEALAAARALIDESLEEVGRPGMTGEEWFSHYAQFGTDAYLISDDPAVAAFSGWDYARERCHALGAGDGAAPAAASEPGPEAAGEQSRHLPITRERSLAGYAILSALDADFPAPPAAIPKS